VHDAGTRFIILLLWAPEILERAEWRENRTTDPDRVFAFGRSNNLDLHASGWESREFFLHTVSDTGEHGRAAREDHISIQIATDVEVALEDGIIPVT
jgi:hypothetical protein